MARGISTSGCKGSGVAKAHLLQDGEHEWPVYGLTVQTYCKLDV